MSVCIRACHKFISEEQNAKVPNLSTFVSILGILSYWTIGIGAIYSLLHRMLVNVDLFRHLFFP